MAETPSYKKGDRVFWWTNYARIGTRISSSRIYLSEAPGTYKRYGTIAGIRGKSGDRWAEVTPEDPPDAIVGLAFRYLHKA